MTSALQLVTKLNYPQTARAVIEANRQLLELSLLETTNSPSNKRSKMFSPTITCFATASTNAAAKINANAKLKAFRQITQSRVSARRFEPNVAVPDDVWRDVLRMTLVSGTSGFDYRRKKCM